MNRYWGGTKRFNFLSDPNAINVNHTAHMTLANSFPDSIVQFSFGMVDCDKMKDVNWGDVQTDCYRCSFELWL